MEMILESLATLPGFLTYFAVSLVLTLIYVALYTWVTPHAEIKLIREDNLAAVIAFIGSLIGFAIPLASAIANSVTLMDCVLWGLVALIVQILAYLVTSRLLPNLSERIENGVTAAGLWLGGVSLAAGLLNAACMIG